MEKSKCVNVCCGFACDCMRVLYCQCVRTNCTQLQDLCRWRQLRSDRYDMRSAGAVPPHGCGFGHQLLLQFRGCRLLVQLLRKGPGERVGLVEEGRYGHEDHETSMSTAARSIQKPERQLPDRNIRQMEMLLWTFEVHFNTRWCWAHGELSSFMMSTNTLTSCADFRCVLFRLYSKFYGNHMTVHTISCWDNNENEDNEW